MELLKQTRDAIKGLPLSFKAAFFISSSVPIFLIFPSIKNSSLLNTTYAFCFVLIWIMLTLAIILMSVFRRENKKALKKHAENNFISKINGHVFAAALQSNSAYEHLKTMLPPHLTRDVRLYIATRWGRIAKIMIMIMIVSYVGIILLTAQFSQ